MGTEKKRIPDFLAGEILPKGSFEPVNPYISAPTRKPDIVKPVAYAKRHWQHQWVLTK